MAFDTIKLDKGLYTTGKGFTRSLEEIDPSDNYRGTALEGLDAYQRQLKRFDIKVSGRDSDTVAKFFNTTDSAALFPEYVARAVRQGIEESNPLEALIATTTDIDALDYRAIEVLQDDDATALADVVEGAMLPETTIRTKETLTPLKKRGRMLTASYEAIKFQKLDVFTIMLKQIGNQIAKGQMMDLLGTIWDSEAHVISLIDSDDGITYADVVNLWNAFSPYNLTTIIAGNNAIATLLNMAEFRDSHAGLATHANGQMITPMGAAIVKLPVMDSVSDTLIGIDKNYAVEKVQAGGVMTEFDKLIDRQLERTAISTLCGFSKISNDAVQILGGE